MAASPRKPDVRPACAWTDFVLLRGCVYRAAEGERYCIRHLVEAKVADRDQKKEAA